MLRIVVLGCVAVVVAIGVSSALLFSGWADRLWPDSTALRAGRIRVPGDDGSGSPPVAATLPAADRAELDRAWLDPQFPPDVGAVEPYWPAFRGPRGDGKSLDTGLLKHWPEGGPPLKWKVGEIGEGYSSVAVVGESVYVTGDVDGQLMLFAFDSEGHQKWKVPHGPAWTGGYPGSRSTPTFSDRRLYLLSGHGWLGCFDAGTGKRLGLRVAEQFGGRPGEWGYSESPLVLGDLVIFRLGGEKCLVALDRQTGSSVWTSRGLNATCEYGCSLAFEHAGRKLVATGTGQGLVCLDPQSGRILWTNPFASGNLANCTTPVYADGYLFWAVGYGVGAICLKLDDAGLATEAWTSKEMDCHHGGYVIERGHVYGNHASSWSCLDLKTGQVRWNERGVGKGSLCWADGMLYLLGELSGEAALATCTPEGLEIRGRLKVQGEGSSWAHPVVAGRRLYLRYGDNLYCYDVSDREAEGRDIRMK
ncbi:MAG: PQQ-binding-like beta-propeller repeat protein [Planctomycetota bacterium]